MYNHPLEFSGFHPFVQKFTAYVMWKYPRKYSCIDFTTISLQCDVGLTVECDARNCVHLAHLNCEHHPTIPVRSQMLQFGANLADSGKWRWLNLTPINHQLVDTTMKFLCSLVKRHLWSSSRIEVNFPQTPYEPCSSGVSMYRVWGVTAKGYQFHILHSV